MGSQLNSAIILTLNIAKSSREIKGGKKTEFDFFQKNDIIYM